MRFRIHKYALEVARDQIVDALVVRWLGVGWQGEELVLWAEVSVGGHHDNHIVVALTGDEPPTSVPGMPTDHLGTAERGDGFVTHVYLVHP